MPETPFTRLIRAMSAEQVTIREVQRRVLELMRYDGWTGAEARAREGLDVSESPRGTDTDAGSIPAASMCLRDA